MSAVSVFDHVCDGVERGTSLDRLQSRGTVRLALKEAGLEPSRAAIVDALEALARPDGILARNDVSLREKEGLGAALRWRADQFKD